MFPPSQTSTTRASRPKIVVALLSRGPSSRVSPIVSLVVDRRALSCARNICTIRCKESNIMKITRVNTRRLLTGPGQDHGQCCIRRIFRTSRCIWRTRLARILVLYACCYVCPNVPWPHREVRDAPITISQHAIRLLLAAAAHRRKLCGHDAHTARTPNHAR
jgi:hypothetical protein